MDSDGLSGKTVVQLRELLRENNLKVSGKKSELVDRLVSFYNVPIQKLTITEPQPESKTSGNVVCVKVGCIRPKYNNLKEWCEDKNNVYIGRKGIVFIVNPETGTKERYPKENSIWANPFKVKDDGREAASQKYRIYIMDKIQKDPVTYNLETLRGKTLGCWCKPDTCHGDVLSELLSNQ